MNDRQAMYSPKYSQSELVPFKWASICVKLESSMIHECSRQCVHNGGLRTTEYDELNNVYCQKPVKVKYRSNEYACNKNSPVKK